MIEYDDFSLKIEPKQGDVYPVIVLKSPAGEGRSSLALPFQPDEIGDILFNLSGMVRGSGEEIIRDVSPAATSTRPRQIGDQLFNALFSGSTRSLLDRSLGMIHGHQRGLRIKLHIDPEDPGLAQLASLPWEFLYRKETRDFLNLSRYTPIIRYLDVQRPYTPLPLEPPLRILVIISSPVDYTQLDLERERSLIESSWAKQKGVQVEFMEEATILALQDRLSERPFHVLHYMGHGGLDERTGRGVLVMEDGDGKGSLVDGRTLGILLRDLPMMRLAFLNACETAKATKEMGVDPFAGVAAAMVLAGIPAVVAMQFPVSDKAAITFSQKFYPLLARGESVDTAVAEGRRAIRLAENETMEWGTPVLFLRAPQGVIFKVSEIHREKLPLPEVPDSTEEYNQALDERLAVLYTRGLSYFWVEEWEKSAHTFEAILNVRPNYEDAAEKLAEARRQAKLHALYAQALAAEEEEKWSSALAALEALTAETSDFKDSVERLQHVRVQNQLAELYDEAEHLHRAQQWQAVIKVFEQINSIDPDYPDPQGLLPTAEQEVATQKQHASLSNLYSHALREINAGHWQEAHQLLVQVQETEPGFQETERLLTRVEQEIEKVDAEIQQQERIALLYRNALNLAGAQKWGEVLDSMEEIHDLNPRFTDTEGIAIQARKELMKEIQEAKLDIKPSLSLKLSVNPQEVKLGEKVTWTVTLHNDGNTELAQVTVRHRQKQLNEHFALAEGEKRILSFDTSYWNSGEMTEVITASGLASNGEKVSFQTSGIVNVLAPYREAAIGEPEAPTPPPASPVDTQPISNLSRWWRVGVIVLGLVLSLLFFEFPYNLHEIIWIGVTLPFAIIGIEHFLKKRRIKGGFFVLVALVGLVFAPEAYYSDESYLLLFALLWLAALAWSIIDAIRIQNVGAQPQGTATVHPAGQAALEQETQTVSTFKRWWRVGSLILGPIVLFILLIYITNAYYYFDSEFIIGFILSLPVLVVGIEHWRRQRRGRGVYFILVALVATVAFFFIDGDLFTMLGLAAAAMWIVGIVWSIVDAKNLRLT